MARTSGAAQRRIAAWIGVGTLTQYSKSRLHGGDLCLLPRNDLFGESANQWISPVNERQPRHFDRALVVRDHGGEEIDIRIACRPCSHHVLVHLVHACSQRTGKSVILHRGVRRSMGMTLLRPEGRQTDPSSEEARGQ